MTREHCCSRRDVLLAAAWAGAVATGCATVPETGRSQLIFVPESQMNTLGLQAYQEILKKEKVSRDPEGNAMVRRVGERIAAASGKDYAWEYTLIESDQVNAFCLPGGKIGVYTGILPVAGDDAGLATVMGHEVAHATARHGAERMSQSTLVQGLAVGGGLALGGGDQNRTRAAVAALGAGAAVGVILPFSRKQESEADRIGLRYMARAGYEPEASIGFWERMGRAAEGKKRPPEFLSTHPSGETRIRRLREWIPEAKAEYRPRG